MTSYESLMEAYQRVEDILRDYRDKHESRKVRKMFEHFLDSPDIPNELDMTDREMDLRKGYLNDHMPLLTDIQNDKEYQALTIIFREFRVSMHMRAKKAHE